MVLGLAQTWHNARTPPPQPLHPYEGNRDRFMAPALQPCLHSGTQFFVPESSTSKKENGLIMYYPLDYIYSSLISLWTHQKACESKPNKSLAGHGASIGNDNNETSLAGTPMQPLPPFLTYTRPHESFEFREMGEIILLHVQKNLTSRVHPTNQSSHVAREHLKKPKKANQHGEPDQLNCRPKS